MDFKELRKQSGMNQKQFCEHFGIPARTVQHWEAGTRKCPNYVLDLIKFRLDNEELKEGFVEIETNDFSNEDIHRTLCRKYGDSFIKLDEIEHAIKHGAIEICKGGIIIH